MADAHERAAPAFLIALGVSDTVAGVFLVLITILVFLLPIFALFPPNPPQPSDAAAQTHVKVGLPKSKSNLKKKPSNNGSSSTPSVQSIWIYPVKSCGGIEVSKCRVLPQGLQFDRLFTFAQLKTPFPASSSSSSNGSDKEQSTWHFITQRQFPLLATLTVDLWIPDNTSEKWTPFTSTQELSDVFLIIRFPWRDAGLLGFITWLSARLRGSQPQKEILLPVAVPDKEQMEREGYSHAPVTIWKDTIEAIDMSVELPRELQLYLGVSNKLGLFRVDPEKLREVMRCAPRKDAAGYQPVTGFQDAYPLHMVTVESLRDFESKVKLDAEMRELDVRRFRANVIGELFFIVLYPEWRESCMTDGACTVHGAKPYDEETWKTMSFKSKNDKTKADFHVSCRTVRYVV